MPASRPSLRDEHMKPVASGESSHEGNDLALPRRSACPVATRSGFAERTSVTRAASRVHLCERILPIH
jgi:hypothetical protein